MSFTIHNRVNDQIEIVYKVRLNLQSRKFCVERISIDCLDAASEINGSLLRSVTVESALRSALRQIHISQIRELRDAEQLISNDPKLGEVALVYAIAWVMAEEPAKAVSEALDLPLSTASLHIRNAKKASHVDYAISFVSKYLEELTEGKNVRVYSA